MPIIKTKVMPLNSNDIPQIKPRSPTSIALIIASSVLGAILIAAIVAIAYTGSNPCSFTKCHEKATCVNHAFYGECVCNYGYSGNGRDHCDECGVTNFPNNANEEGSKAVPYSWPATGILEFTYTTLAHLDAEKLIIYGYDYCGAVLINRQTVLTAAHCIKRSFDYFDYWYEKNFKIDVVTNNFHPTLESIFSIFFGADQFVYYGSDMPQIVLADFKEIVIHPDYNPETLENNIAIFKLSKPIELNRYIQITCLPNQTSNEIPEISKQYAYVNGYGGSGSSYGSWVQLNTIMNLYNNSMCAEVSPDKNKNWSSQFCAGEYDQHGNGSSNCHGDYGSSLYTLEDVNGEQKYVTTGILSYDVSCSTAHSPGVYTRVSHYLDWIKENSKY